MGSKVRILSLAVLMIVVLLIGFTAGVALDRQYSALAEADTSGNQSSVNLQLIQEAYNLIKDNYADRPAIKSQDLTYGAISGMVSALGDTGHSVFLTPEMLKEVHQTLQGEFEGIGAQVQMKDGIPTIVAPFDNSPAQKAGLRPGDMILKVNGEDVTSLPLDQVVGRILGPAGTQVTLTVQDPETGKTRELTITRAKIQIQNVTWQMLPGTTIAHIRLAEFSQNVSDDLVAAIKDARSQGATSLVIDLRNNPGGYLDEAVKVASQFLKDGNVLLVKNAQGQTREIKVEKGGIATDIPIVVLVNEGTASAAEIVSGALQDYGRAQLIGAQTFGTGTVLNEFPLSDGSAIRLATQLWLTPKGRVIWHQGIQPDVTVALPDNVYPQTPEQERTMTPQELQASQDAQLLKAIQVLQNH